MSATQYECSECGQRFLGLTAFDAHRTGDHARRQRRCFSHREMSKQGLQRNAQGQWFLPVQEQFTAWISKEKKQDARIHP